MKIQSISVSTLLLYLCLLEVCIVTAFSHRNIFNYFLRSHQPSDDRKSNGSSFTGRLKDVFVPTSLNDQSASASVTVDYKVDDIGTTTTNSTATATNLDDDCLAYWEQLVHLFGDSINVSKAHSNPGGMARACRYLKSQGVAVGNVGKSVSNLPAPNTDSTTHSGGSGFFNLPTTSSNGTAHGGKSGLLNLPIANSNITAHSGRSGLSNLPTTNSNGTTHNGHDNDGAHSDSDSDKGTTVKVSNLGVLQKLKDLVMGRQHDGTRGRLFINRLQDFIDQKLNAPKGD